MHLRLHCGTELRNLSSSIFWASPSSERILLPLANLERRQDVPKNALGTSEHRRANFFLFYTGTRRTLVFSALTVYDSIRRSPVFQSTT